MPERFVPALRFHFLTRFYDPLLDRFFSDSARKLRLIDLGPPGPGERVLDLGGGTATLARLLLRREPRCRIVVLDVDLAMLVRARGKLASAASSWHLVIASADALPFAATSFDRAFSSLVFHHLVPPVKRAALAELHRVLRVRGSFFLLDFARPADPLMWLVSSIAGLFDGWKNTVDNLLGRLPGMVKSAGFEEVRERHRERTAFGVLGYLTATKGNQAP